MRVNAEGTGRVSPRALKTLQWILLSLAFTCPAQAQESAPRFAVRSFQIEGDLPIPREEALAIVSPFAGEGIEVGQLQKAATALEEALFARGFSFYRVILPPQDLAGVVTLRVLPFKLGNVSVKGNQYFSEANILASLPSLRKGESPNVSQVGRNRSAANEHPSKEVEVTFRQSDVPDSVDAEVAVLDQQPQSFFIGLNNIGERRTGNYRATVGYQHSNLWNRDHSVTATYTTSPDHFSDVRQYGLYYRVPFYSVAGALTVFYAYSDVNSGTIANAFEVSGRGKFAGIHWRQHLVPHGAYSHALEAGLDDRYFENSVLFSGAQIGVDVRSRPVNVSYNARLDRADSVITGSIQYARNVSGGAQNDDAAYTANRAGASPDWQALRYSLDGQWRVASWVLAARLRGQYSAEPLIPGEQFGLGGAASVRGLREREVTGDTGVSFTVEGIVPMPWAQGLSAVVFTDAGEVRSRNVPLGQPGRQDAVSVGVGLRWVVARRFSLAVDAAQVLNGTTATESGDRRVHFSLVYRF